MLDFVDHWLTYCNVSLVSRVGHGSIVVKGNS